MKPRIGAIFARGCVWIATAACALVITCGTFAQDEPATTPGPRPQAIDFSPMVLLDAPPEVAADQPVDATLGSASEEQAKSEEATAKSRADSEVALGLPAKAAHEALPLAGAVEAPTGMLGSLDPRSNEVARVVGALAVVIGLMLLLRVVARKFGGPLLDGGRPSGVLLVLARYPIGRGQSMVLMKLGRRLLLCHQTKGAMSTLCEIQSEDEVASMLARIEAGSRGKDAARFEKLLEDFNQDHRRRALPAQRSGGDMRSAMANAPVIDLTKRAPSSGGAANWLRLRRTAS